MEETWSKTEKLENYEVSSEGRVRNSKTGKILNPAIDSKGYETVTVRENGRRVTKRVGKLVADTYLETDPDKPYVGYIDGNKRNNRFNNLKRKRCGRKVCVLETGEIYNSISECSKAIGVNKSTISKCCNYEFYKNKRGLHFKFVD